MKKKEDKTIIVPAISIDNDLEEIGNDLDNINKDTDEILRQLIKTLNSLQDNNKYTISTKRWVITLFLLDKIIMFIIMILAIRFGTGII